jgi:hypothetical protein
MRTFFAVLTFWAITCSADAASSLSEDAAGREIMDAVYERHYRYPYVYEEQSMVLIDRFGNRETRKLKRYTRASEDGAVDFLLVFATPVEVEGVAVHASRAPDGTITEQLYLPAFGETLVEKADSADGSYKGSASGFLGTDFSIENIAGEDLDDYIYVRRTDSVQDELTYYVVDVFLPADEKDINAKQPLRRHFITQETLYITRTDHFNNLGRLQKRLTNHDLTPVLGDMWRANMILMENFAEKHKTLIKIDRRVFSEDYVPTEVFTREWLFANFPYVEPPADEASDEQG